MSVCAIYKYSKSDGSIYCIYWYKVHWVEVILCTHAKVVYTCGETAIISLGVDIDAASHPASISHNDYCDMDDHRIDEKKTNRYVHIIRGTYIQKELCAEPVHLEKNCC